MTERNIRRALGRDPEHSEKLRDSLAYRATMRRIRAKRPPAKQKRKSK